MKRQKKGKNVKKEARAAQENAVVDIRWWLHGVETHSTIQDKASTREMIKC